MRSLLKERLKNTEESKATSSPSHDIYMRYYAYQKAYREAHREYYREYAKEYRKEHPRSPLGERSTQAIYEIKDPDKLHKYLKRELARLGLQKD